MDISVEFSGGAELLFDKKKQHSITLDTSKDQKWTLGRLVVWLTDNLLKGKHELFATKDVVRPGILVLVNDTDWELLGERDYQIQPNDRILFISTLHGG